ncbi:hypothetical protein QC764_0096600 [Podospora pseudoanserina]|uniref:Uncharacterized protein n=1 Tax=Podospora pseudoanserina TaxID=2609844 RepID=A0ABR0HU10_9PEZI|nr:hypothetical protein QC764_0096600 [Podospora pseudoanserina]
MAAAEDSLTPVIEKQASLTPFAAAAVMRIIELANEGVSDKTASLEICKLLLLKSVFDTMSLTKLRTVETAEAEFRNASKSRSNGYPYYQMRPIRDGPHQNPETYITPNFLAECLARCIELNWDDLAMRFSPIIVANIAQVPPAEFHYLWLPFVRQLISTLAAANVSVSTPPLPRACACCPGSIPGEAGRKGARRCRGLFRPGSCKV